MSRRNIGRSILFLLHCLGPVLGLSQQVEDVPQAFNAIGHEPEIILLSNEIEVPRKGGHLQGVQVIEQNGSEKLLISGSSLHTAYVLVADLATLKTEKLISLMQSPYRHAGGMQVSEPYLAVGIEDNHAKTSSKVCVYKYQDADLDKASPRLQIERVGEAKKKTAGATGLLKWGEAYLMVVSNWDSRNWDFYRIMPEKNQQ